MERVYILTINPGSTSTKISLFKENRLIERGSIEHPREDFKNNNIYAQLDYRFELIDSWINSIGLDYQEILAVVGRGGMLRPIPSGVYKVTDKMIRDLYDGIGGEHASNLGGILARRLGDIAGVDAFIVDPVSVDEMDELARISGLNLIERRSSAHALNIKAVSYRRAAELHRKIEDLNFIVAHLGGGISICPLAAGRILDVNNANEMGPFSPERTGTLPSGDLLELCYSQRYTFQEINKKIRGQGGLMSYLNTNDARIVEEKINRGDSYARLIYDAMAYQIAKEIASMATVVKGKVDSIILTGGLCHSSYLIEKLSGYIGFIGELVVYPGEDEMESLNEGVVRVMTGKEKVKNYDEVIGND